MPAYDTTPCQHRRRHLGGRGPLTVSPCSPARRAAAIWAENISLGERVAFTALTQTSHYVLVAWDGTSLLRIADDDDPAPGGSHPYNGFGMTAIDGDDLAFVAWEQVTYRPGLYLHSGGNTALVVAGGMPLPEEQGRISAHRQRQPGARGRTDGVQHENSDEPIGIYRHSGGVTERVVTCRRCRAVPAATDLQIRGDRSSLDAAASCSRADAAGRGCIWPKTAT
jgi:hypothetical protein